MSGAAGPERLLLAGCRFPAAGKDEIAADREAAISIAMILPEDFGKAWQRIARQRRMHPGMQRSGRCRAQVAQQVLQTAIAKPPLLAVDADPLGRDLTS